MSSHRHPLRSPDFPALLSSLRNFSVSFVVVGSAAVKMHGVDLEPGDLDIVPHLESANLLRLVAALKSLEASVSDIDRVGHWLTGEGGEWSWTSREATDAERGALLSSELRADDIDSWTITS
jgi:hypothetical protein